MNNTALKTHKHVKPEIGINGEQCVGGFYHFTTIFYIRNGNMPKSCLSVASDGNVKHLQKCICTVVEEDLTCKGRQAGTRCAGDEYALYDLK